MTPVIFVPSKPLSLGLLLGIGLIAAVSAVFLGLLAAFLPYQIILMLVLVPGMLILPWFSPWLGLIGLLALVMGLIPEHYVPPVPVLGGRIHAEDLFLAYLFSILVIHHVRGARDWWKAFTPYFLPLSLLLIMSIGSTLYALTVLHTAPKEVLGELRHLLYWMVAPMVMISLGSERKANYFIRALLLLAVLLALGLIAQSIFGITVLSGGRMEETRTLGISAHDAIRSTTPGIYLVLFGLFFLTARYLWQVEYSALGLPGLMLFGAGLIVTYGRTLWLTSAMGMVYLVFLAKGRRVLQLSLFGLALFVLGAGVIGYAKPNTLGAIYDRLSSYGTEITSGESLEWRYVENNYALSHIYRNPMVGVGLGGDYKPAYRPEVFEGEHRYLHNGYLYLMLKLGVLSLVPLAWLYWVIYRRGHFLLRSEMSDRHRAVTAACLVVISIPLITSLTRPEWMTEGSIATLATLIGLMGSIQALRDTSIQLKAEKPTDSLFH